MDQSRFAAIPQIDALLNQSGHLITDYGRTVVAAEIRNQIERIRAELVKSERAQVPSTEQIVASAETNLKALHQASLRPVLNLSGTVLHTNLGRAVLPQAAIDAMNQVARTACNLEFDLNTIDSALIKSKVFRGMEFIFEKMDTSNITGKTYLPIFLNEAVSKVYGDNVLRKEKVEIKGNKNNRVSHRPFLYLHTLFGSWHLGLTI